MTSGVVNIFNVFMANSILNRPSKKNDQGQAVVPEDSAGMDKTVSKDEAIQFLERYGARPQYEELPMVHHPQYEFFIAYQKFLLAWSRQFLSTFSLTFMPELFPGGKVGFPDHALQMYIEEVSHQWDYESGFITQANLSAPSVFKTGNNDDSIKYLPENMITAMIEPVRDKGVTSKLLENIRERDAREEREGDADDSGPPTAPRPNPPRPLLDGPLFNPGPVVVRPPDNDPPAF
jgi:hypothetical protein